MGPPSLNGGNLLRLRGLEPLEQASMGPPSLNGGNLHCGWKRVRGISLQWGRRLSTAETGGYVFPSIGLVAWSFNGAAVSQRRKLAVFRVGFGEGA